MEQGTVVKMVVAFYIIYQICFGLHQGGVVYVPEGPGGVKAVSHPGDFAGELPAISVLQPGQEAGGYIKMAGYGSELRMACE